MNYLQELQIEQCSRHEYTKFKHLHFVKRDPICIDKAFIIRPDIAIILYAYPPLSSRMRREVFQTTFNHGTRSEIAKRINRNVRLISRLVVKKELHNHHIATYLLKKTLPLIKKPLIEAYTNLFGASKFFLNAGFLRYFAKPDELWFRIEQLYKELNLPNKNDITDNELFAIFQKMTPEKKQYFKHYAKLYLNKGKALTANWSIIEIHKELINRRDQQPFYYYWKNPQLNFFD